MPSAKREIGKLELGLMIIGEPELTADEIAHFQRLIADYEQRPTPSP